MIHSILKTAEHFGLIDNASAHCDIPCGIYDPGPALVAAVSVLRHLDILADAENKEGSKVAIANLVSRNVASKETQAELVKHEIRVIWGDYFKPELVAKHPNIHQLTHDIMRKASACKQDVHREAGVELVELVNQFAEIFWETKGVKTERKTCPYKPSVAVVTPVL